jgi:hypothetical protein
MCKYDAWRIVGKDINVTDGAGEDESSPNVEKNDGDLIGISVAENYARVDLSQCLLTVEGSGIDRPIKDVPVTQFLPDGERQMWPFLTPIPAGTKLTVKLVSRSANTLAVNPIVLIFHHRNPKSCG